MVKRLIAASFFITLLALVLRTSPASAHVLKFDGDIAAILHINPDDDPISGTPTQYILYFDDDTGKFTLPKCNCRIDIQENGQVISTQPLTITNDLESIDTFTFPKPDVYNLIVSGQPKVANTFQTFTLTYLVRVGTVNNQAFPRTLWIGMGLMIGLVLLGAYAMEHTNETNERDK